MNYRLLTPSELAALKALTERNSLLPGDELIYDFMSLMGKEHPQRLQLPRVAIRLRDWTPPVYSIFVSSSASKRNAEVLGLRLTGIGFSEHGGDLLQSIIELLPGPTVRQSIALSFVVRAAILKSVPPQKFRAWQWGVRDLYGLASEHELRVASECSSILQRSLQEESTAHAFKVPKGRAVEC
jgi:hypothetical protein